MKIGITIPGYYEQYLDKIANLNGCSLTRVCSLIVENFLSYNLKLKKFPLFRKDVRIVFTHEVSKSDIDNFSNPDSPGADGSNSEYSSMSREEFLSLFEDVPEDPEDSGFPFEYDSGD